MEWISVKERLPEKGARVLAFVSFDGIRSPTSHEAVATFVGVSDSVLAWSHPRQYDGFRVTHWMPLPPPPEDESHVLECTLCGLVCSDIAESCTLPDCPVEPFPAPPED